MSFRSSPPSDIRAAPDSLKARDFRGNRRCRRYLPVAAQASRVTASFQRPHQPRATFMLSCGWPASVWNTTQ